MSNELIKNDYLQMMPIEQAKAWYDEFVQFSKSILKLDLDFGIIPGTPKPTLYKAGAEKMRFVYGYGVEFECIDKVVDFDRPFVDYAYRCTIKSKAGQLIAQCEGSCNSMEAKYGYLWKTKEELGAGYDVTGLPVKTSGRKLSELDFAINKGETTGNYGKPKEHWEKFKKAIASGKAKKVTRPKKSGGTMDAWEIDESATVYRILNPDVIGSKNTIMKMAQKRAFVGATLLATGASEFFTQDLEDMQTDAPAYTDFTDIQHEDVAPPAPVIVATEKEIKAANKILNGCKNLSQLQVEYTALSKELRTATLELKDKLKGTLPVVDTLIATPGEGATIIEDGNGQ